jgi:hypothetical protein
MAGRGLSSFYPGKPNRSGHVISRVRDEVSAEALPGEHTGNPVRRTRWVLASLGVYACGALIASSMLADAGRPDQATAFLEKLETVSSRLDRLPLQTSREIKRLMAQPQFDCTRISCEPNLWTRNQVVRTRLESRLAGEVTQIATK